MVIVRSPHTCRQLPRRVEQRNYPSACPSPPSSCHARAHIKDEFYACYCIICSMHARRPFSPPTPAQHVASGGANPKLVNKLAIRGSIGEHAASARVQIFAKVFFLSYMLSTLVVNRSSIDLGSRISTISSVSSLSGRQYQANSIRMPPPLS